MCNASKDKTVVNIFDDFTSFKIKSSAIKLLISKRYGVFLITAYHSPKVKLNRFIFIHRSQLRNFALKAT